MKKICTFAFLLLLSLCAGATSYTWNKSGWAEWNDPVFWSPNTGYPQAGDTAIFASTGNVYLCNHATVATLTTSAYPLYLCNDGILSFGALTGSTAGLLSLSGVTLNPTTAMTISNPIAVTTGFDGIVRVPSDGATTLKGKLTGSGYFTAEYADAATGGGLVFDNDTSEYTGIVTVPAGGANTRSGITSGNARNNALSAWRIFADDETLPSTFFFRVGSGTTYTFGALDLNFNGTIAGRDAGLTFEIGARDEDSSVKGDFGSGSTDKVKWAATSATLSLSAANLATLEIAGGTVALASGVVPNAIKLTGGYLKADDATLATALAKVTDTTTLGFDLDADLTLAKSSIPAGVTTISKKGAGTLTLTGDFTDGALALAIGGGDVKVPKDSVFSSVQFATDDATCRLYITGVDADPTLGTTILTINAITGSVTPTRDNFEFTDDATNPKCAYLDGTAVKIGERIFPYVWTGTGDNDWFELSNWTYNGGTPTTLPTTESDVVLQGGLVVVTGTVQVAKTTVNARTVVTGTGRMLTTDYRGEGVLAISNFTIEASVDNVNIRCPLEIADDSSNTLYNHSKNVYVYGNMTGGGYVNGLLSANQLGTRFYGDNSGFSGYFKSSGSPSARDQTYFNSASSWSENARWEVYMTTKDYQHDAYLVTSSGDYKIGAFTGRISIPYSYTPNLEFGARDDVASSLIYIHRYAGMAAIRKVGTNVLSVAHAGNNGSGQPYSYTVAGGILELKDTDVLPTQFITMGGDGAVLKLDVAMDPSALFKDSVSAIAIDDNGVDNTFASVITEDNCVGFTKKGAGTLTFAVAPEYVGITTVEEGTLVFPKGATVSSVKMLAGAYLAVSADSYALGDELLTIGSVDTTEGVALTSENLKLVGASSAFMCSPVQQADGSYKIVVVADTKKYVWSGAAGDGLWSTPGNWTKAGAVASRAPVMGEDEVVFLQDASVSLGNTNVYNGANLSIEDGVRVEMVYTAVDKMNMSISHLDCPVTFNSTGINLILNQAYTIDATLTIKGNFRLAYNGAVFSGTGSVVLGDCTLRNEATASAQIDAKFEVPVEIMSGATATLDMPGNKSKPKGRILFNAAVTGGGTIVAQSHGYNWCGPIFNGEMSGFTGRVIYTNTAEKGNIRFATAATNMSNSAWSIFYDSGIAGIGTYPFEEKSCAYAFGSLDLNMPSNDGNSTTLEIGNLNADSHLTGAFYSGGTQAIRWIAPTATLHTALLNVNTLTVTGGGTVNFAEPKTGVASANGVPLTALTFAGNGGYVVCESNTFAAVTNAVRNSTAPIGFTVAAGETFELDSAMLDESNTLKVFRKAGDGTLSVAENTLFTNLTERLKRTITITDLPAGKRVAFETVDGCEKAVVAEGFTDLEMNVEADVTSNYVGTISGASNLVKTGAGTLVLIGTNCFEGAVTVSAGTLKLGDYGDLNGVLADYDASRTDLMTFTTSDAGETVLATLGDAAGKLAALSNPNAATDGVITNDAAIFGGRTCLDAQSAFLRAPYATSPTNTFMVYKAKSVTTYYTLFRKKDNGNYGIETRNDATIQWRTAAKTYASLAGGIYMNGVLNSSSLTVNPTVLNIATNWMVSTSTWADYACSPMYFGELLTFDRDLTDAERTLVSTRLMSKWGIQDSAYAVVPTTADITVAAGATLDLGTQVPTVPAVMLTSGAILKLDKVADDGIILRTSLGSAGDVSGVTVILNGQTVITGSDEDEYTLTQTADGLVMTKNPPSTFTWVGTTDSDWFTLSNWQRNGRVPSRLPTAADHVVFTASAAVTLTNSTSAMDISATGDLSLTGGSISVVTDVIVSGSFGVTDATVDIGGTLTATTIRPQGTTITGGNSAAAPAETTLRAAAIVGSVQGDGNVETDADVPFASDSDLSFVGTLTCSNVVKTGSGVLSLRGVNAIEGNVQVEAGTLKLASPYEMGTMIFDFDASVTSSVVTDESGAFTQWNSAQGESVSLASQGTYLPALTNDAAIFGGRTALAGDAVQFLDANGNHSYTTTFIMWQRFNTSGDYSELVGEQYSNSKYYIRRRSKSNSYYSWHRGGGGDSTANLWSNGEPGAPIMASAQLMTVCGTWMYANKRPCRYLSGTALAVGEILSYSTAFTMAQREAMENYLMAKWNVNDVSYDVLSKTAAVSVSAGATLDLGEFAPTVSSLSLVDGSTIAVDALPSDGVVLTANTITVGSDIVIKIGGETKSTYRLRVRNNGDGTYSLRILKERRGVVFFLK